MHARKSMWKLAFEWLISEYWDKIKHEFSTYKSTKLCETYLQELTILQLKNTNIYAYVYTPIYVNYKHKAKWMCYGLNFGANSYVKALTPRVTIFGDGAFKEVINVKWSHKTRALMG